MKANQARYPVALMCRLLSISKSGYYAWRDRPMGPRAERDAELLAQIKTFYAQSGERYGAPKIHVDLQEAGESVSRKRIARLMRNSGLVGVLRHRTFRTIKRREDDRPAPDLVKRRFVADAPDRLWVADITYVSTWEGNLLGRRLGCLQPPDRRLGHGEPRAHRARLGCAEHGRRSAST